VKAIGSVLYRRLKGKSGHFFFSGIIPKRAGAIAVDGWSPVVGNRTDDGEGT
jgi:hypothetical protein